jgi:hypothetical protein
MATARWSSRATSRAHDLGVDHAAGGVDGDVHRQLAVELAALEFRKVARAALLDAAAQRVVVQRVDLFARGRADVALLRACVLVVDALLDLGQQAQQLAAALVLLALLRACRVALRVGRRQQRPVSRRICASNCCCSSCSWSMRRRASSAESPDLHVACAGSGEVARPLSVAAAGQVGLRDGLRLGGASFERALTRITSSGVSRNTRLKPSGSTKRKVSSAAVHAPAKPAAPSAGGDGPAMRRGIACAQAQGAARSAGRASGGVALGGRASFVQVDGQRQRAAGSAVSSSSAACIVGRRWLVVVALPGWRAGPASAGRCR